MTQPLALVLYENLLPGTQLVNRLQELNYRVQTINDAAALVPTAQQLRPMLVLADVNSTQDGVCPAIAQLRQNPDTSHLPVVAFGADNRPDLETAARAAGVALVAGEAALLNHLSLILDQVLQIE